MKCSLSKLNLQRAVEILHSQFTIIWSNCSQLCVEQSSKFCLVMAGSFILTITLLVISRLESFINISVFYKHTFQGQSLECVLCMRQKINKHFDINSKTIYTEPKRIQSESRFLTFSPTTLFVIERQLNEQRYMKELLLIEKNVSTS